MALRNHIQVFRIIRCSPANSVTTCMNSSKIIDRGQWSNVLSLPTLRTRLLFPMIKKHFCSTRSITLKRESNDITKCQEGGDVQTASFAKKTKENVKTASYGAVIVVGIGVTGFILYTVLRELFSGDSPNSLFQLASDKCMEHPKVQDLLGEPIKAFGEETRRGRRRHVASLSYVDEQGRKGLRVQFYLQGLRKRANAQIDAREDENGTLRTRYIIVTADDLLRTSIVVEDNR